MLRNTKLAYPCPLLFMQCLLIFLAADGLEQFSCCCSAKESHGKYLVQESATGYAKTAKGKWHRYRMRQDTSLGELIETQDGSFTLTGETVVRVLSNPQEDIGRIDQWDVESKPVEYKRHFDLSVGGYVFSKEMPPGSVMWLLESGGSIGMESLYLPLKKEALFSPKPSSGIISFTSHPSLAPHFTGTWSYALEALQQNHRHLRSHSVLQSKDKQLLVSGTTQMHFRVEPLKFLSIEYEGVIVPADHEDKGMWGHYHYHYLKEHGKAIGEECPSSQVVYHLLMVPANSPERKGLDIPTSLGR